MFLNVQRLAKTVAASALGALLVASVPQMASAQTPVFGNTRTAENGGQTLGPISTNDIILSVRFITGAAPVDISSLLVTVNNSGPVSSTAFGIYSNNANNNPGTLLFNFGSQSFGNANGTLIQTLTYTPGGSFTLQAGTVYHLRNLSSSNAAWRYGSPGAATAVAQNGSGITQQAVIRSLDGGTFYSSHPNAPHFVLFSASAANAPEPGALALLLLPMAGGVAQVARRRK